MILPVIIDIILWDKTLLIWPRFGQRLQDGEWVRPKCWDISLVYCWAAVSLDTGYIGTIHQTDTPTAPNIARLTGHASWSRCVQSYQHVVIMTVCTPGPTHFFPWLIWSYLLSFWTNTNSNHYWLSGQFGFSREIYD